MNPEDLTVRWNNKTLQLVSGEEHVITDVVVREKKPSDVKFRFYGESFNDIITFDGKDLITISYHGSVKKTEIVLDNCKLFTASVLFFHTLLDDFLNWNLLSYKLLRYVDSFKISIQKHLKISRKISWKDIYVGFNFNSIAGICFEK